MPRPLIGISCGTSAFDEKDPGRQDRLNRAYCLAVADAGGIPVILPNVADSTEALRRLDGLLLSGGYDIAPEIFGEETLNETVQVDALRDRAELPLIRGAVESDLPILAICRGIQSLNVAMGGTLIQDIPAQSPGPIAHSQAQPRDALTHEVIVEPGSLMERIADSPRMAVNSFHHQALKDVADGLRVTATAPDGIIEAVEGPAGRFMLGVQFHPEEMVRVSEPARRLFARFVAGALDRM